MMAIYLRLSLLYVGVYVVGALTLLREKVVPDSLIEAKRNSWEIRENVSFPGRSWGVEPRCSSEPQLKEGNREDYVNFFLTPYQTMQLAFKGLEVGPCSMAMPVPEWVHMGYVDIEAHPENNCVGQENKQLAETIIDDATTLETIGNNTYDLFVISHVMEHMGEVVRGIQTWMRVLKPGGMALIIVPHMCDKEVSGDHFRLLTKPRHFINEFHNPTLVTNHEEEHMREAAVAAWGFNNKEVPGFSNAVFFDDVGNGPSAQEISDLAEGICRQNPYANHIHTFTESSVRNLLSLVQSEFPVEYQFDVVDVSSWYVPDYLHGEIRVVLRKKCSAESLAQPCSQW